MFVLVPAHTGCPGQNPENYKMVVCVCEIMHSVSSSVDPVPMWQ